MHLKKDMQTIIRDLNSCIEEKYGNILDDNFGEFIKLSSIFLFEIIIFLLISKLYSRKYLRIYYL